MAERIAALGGWPDACSETLSERNTLESLPFGELPTSQALTAVEAGLERVAAVVTSWLATPSVSQDPVTADLLTSLCRDIMTRKWLARAQQ
ncbi:hypothetical protein [Nonomuraea typhae]|uniref:hypothetical protein n=1 Tax=Nonomuraea typhae TaxID=2603600 RepID=UPI0012FA8C21|nr:hypothetical protein [Nonomuraea typhae]